MNVARDDILRLADLVKIKLEPAEVDAMRDEFASMVRHLLVLDEVATAGVQPLHVFGDGEFREDVPEPSLSADVLAAFDGYDAGAGHFAVPAVFGESRGDGA